MTMFLNSPEGQYFLHSKYAQCFVNPGKLLPDQSAQIHWAFVLLYWRYKKYWNKEGPLETASIPEIVEFLTTHYLEYWQNEISAQLPISAEGESKVFSILIPKPLALKNPTNSNLEYVYTQEFSEFNTPQGASLINSKPLPLINIRKFMNKINQASLDSTIGHQEYSPLPMQSCASLAP
jgi:hypothetical protein